MTENDTPEFELRIRLRAMPPPGEFDEFTLSHFRPGQCYIVPSRLASLLILAGYAELMDGHSERALGHSEGTAGHSEGTAGRPERPAGHPARAEAADFRHRPISEKK